MSGMLNVNVEVNPHFEDFLFDWDYTYYLLVGGYGSSKSHHTALKLILKLMEEKHRLIVIREVYATIKDSCFDLLMSILSNMDMLAEFPTQKNKVQYRLSPLEFRFPNGSRIIFRGMDKPVKLKSLNDVDLAWIEEAPEVKYSGFKEVLGRLRAPGKKVRFLLTLNPTDKKNWVYKHFFINNDAEEKEKRVILNDEELYAKRIIKTKDTYYHHSLPEDNLFIGPDYISRLDEMQYYDLDLYRIAREGRFGVRGKRVLPQFKTVSSQVVDALISRGNKSNLLFFNGLDFGFEESYNALIRVAVDIKKNRLIIYDEYYKNKDTDNITAKLLIKKFGPEIKKEEIVADSAEPKSIAYYRSKGYEKMRKCSKYAGSRLENTKKVKRFREIICAARCRNTIAELKDLTYKIDDKNDELIYDEFNIDPHTLSAIWYALDRYNGFDAKRKTFNSWGDMKKKTA